MAIRKILIVDDSPTERHVLNDMLTKAGFEVVSSDNGEDAIHKSKQLKPDTWCFRPCTLSMHRKL